MARVSFGTRTVLLQSAVVALVVVAGYALFAVTWQQRIEAEYGQRALAVARTVAGEPEIRTGVAACSAAPGTCTAAGPVEAIAEDARIRTGSLFVVVTDAAGTRVAHPDPGLVGRPVSTDPSVALAGGESVVSERGTLGDSARAKVPVRGPDSDAVVGEVSVGIAGSDIADRFAGDLRWAALFGLAALALGVVASMLSMRHLRRQVLGLEPEQIAELVREQEAVLHGIDEGVLAVDPARRVTVANDLAVELLGLSANPSGRSVDELGLPTRVVELLDAGPTPATEVVGDRVLVLVSAPVARGDRALGTVLVVRDVSTVESLTRELDAVRTMTDALRAQRHEFANRLHAVAALVESGRSREAGDYLAEVLRTGPTGALLTGIEAVADPHLQAFLGAKAASARERDVTLQVAEGTWSEARVSAPVGVTTVLGNLVDNAVEAARLGSRRPAEVEIELLEEGATLYMTVADSGDGVPDGVDVFAPGVSRHDGERGLGLAVARRTARATGGDVWLAPADGTEVVEDARGGATFVARLPGVLDVDDASSPTSDVGGRPSSGPSS